MTKQIEVELSLINKMRRMADNSHMALPNEYSVVQELVAGGIPCAEFGDGRLFESWVIHALILWFNIGLKFADMGLVDFVQRQRPYNIHTS